MSHPSSKLKLMTVAVAIAALAIAGAGGFLVGRYKPFARSGIDAYVNHRFEVLRMKAVDAPKGQALLIGDSLTDTQNMNTVCGLQVFNGGVSGSGVADWTSHASPLVTALEPRLVVVALGTNDAIPGIWKDIAQWDASYGQLLRRLSDRHLILVAPPPLDGASDVRDGAALEQIRTRILSLAAPTRSIAAPSFSGRTDDHIHPDQGGRRAWREAIEGACPRGPLQS